MTERGREQAWRLTGQGIENTYKKPVFSIDQCEDSVSGSVIREGWWMIGRCLCLLPPENSGANSPNRDRKSKVYSLHKLRRHAWNQGSDGQTSYWEWKDSVKSSILSSEPLMFSALSSERQKVDILSMKQKVLFLNSNAEKKKLLAIKNISFPFTKDKPVKYSEDNIFFISHAFSCICSKFLKQSS